MKKRIVIPAALAGVFALTAVGYLGYREYQKVTTAEVRCAELNELLDSQGPTLTVSQGKTKVMVLGDSYSTGEVLPDATKGWVYKIGAAESWQTVVDAIGGTGFVAGGYCGDDKFSTRVSHITEAKPQMLIIEGGLNDNAADPAEVSAAAYDLLQSVKTVPKVVLVGPPPAPRKDNLPAIDSALAEAAKFSGIQYVSAINWDLEYSADRLHLSEAGHAKFAKLVADALD